MFLEECLECVLDGRKLIGRPALGDLEGHVQLQRCAQVHVCNALDHGFVDMEHCKA